MADAHVDDVAGLDRRSRSRRRRRSATDSARIASSTGSSGSSDLPARGRADEGRPGARIRRPGNVDHAVVPGRPVSIHGRGSPSPSGASVREDQLEAAGDGERSRRPGASRNAHGPPATITRSKSSTPSRVRTGRARLAGRFDRRRPRCDPAGVAPAAPPPRRERRADLGRCPHHTGARLVDGTCPPSGNAMPNSASRRIAGPHDLVRLPGVADAHRTTSRSSVGGADVEAAVAAHQARAGLPASRVPARHRLAHQVGVERVVVPESDDLCRGRPSWPPDCRDPTVRSRPHRSRARPRTGGPESGGPQPDHGDLGPSLFRHAYIILNGGHRGP